MFPTQLGRSHGYLTKNIGPSVRILQLNCEGISRAKSEYISHIAGEESSDVICLQELHVSDISQLNNRVKIAGYKIVTYALSAIHGSAILVKNNITEVTAEPASTSAAGLELLKVFISGITVVSVYKSPTRNWPQNVIPAVPPPSVYIGDFNSHHTSWGYASNNDDGEKVCDWAETNDLCLFFDAKDNKTFHSARWRRDYNPDLCFVSRNNQDLPIPAYRKVLSKFPNSQHRPVSLSVGVQIPIIRTANLKRWNFRRANWPMFQREVDSGTQHLQATVGSYKSFVKILHEAAKKSIPRGYRKEYIPGWSRDTEELKKHYEATGDPQIPDQIMRSLDSARARRWKETTEEINFTHSSRKGWSLLRRLGSAAPPPEKTQNINPNVIVDRLVMTSRVSPADKTFARKIKKAATTTCRSLPLASPWSHAFSMTELNEALGRMKIRKAPGPDGVFPEFLRNLGEVAKGWLLEFYNNILHTGEIPNEFRKSKILAILKPGKAPEDPASYRPIALLSMCYKLLERLLYNRISPTAERVIIPEQAGFRPNRCCADQVLALTTHIETGYQKGLKTTCAFIDLSSAYDMVWGDGMMYKFQKMFPCKKLSTLVRNMLRNRRITVHINDKKSYSRTIQNGLPQGSVLAPLLFNIYTNDLPPTAAKKFIYADDMALANQHKSLEAGSDQLTDDLEAMYDYYTKWCLKPNPLKSEACVFHLSNRQAQVEANVHLNGTRIRHNPYPTYLGVTLDRSLTFKPHLTKTAQKIKTRNNILYKLAGTTWGADANTLRSAALATTYSVAEYCAPVWYRSSHTHKINVQLNESMRIITGTLKPTPTMWLPILANIAPPQLRRTAAASKEWNKLTNPLNNLPIQQSLFPPPPNRLKSRRPIWLDKEMEVEYNIHSKWNEAIAANHEVRNLDNIIDPTSKPEGMNLPRRTWCRLNRFRVGLGRCRDEMSKWGMVDSAECDCGAPRQTMDHILNECPNRSFPSGIHGIFSASPEAVDWIRGLDIDV